MKLFHASSKQLISTSNPLCQIVYQQQHREYFTNLSWVGTTKGSRIILWHNNHRTQPFRIIQRVEPPHYIAYLCIMLYVKHISKNLGIGAIHTEITPHTIRMGCRINLSKDKV